MPHPLHTCFGRDRGPTLGTTTLTEPRAQRYITMLISSMMSHRRRNALALRSSSLCPLMRSSPRPCQFKPNAWWMASPFKSLAMTACSPVPGPPCTAHRKGSSPAKLSDEISCKTWPATFLQTACLALHPSWATPRAHSSTFFYCCYIDNFLLHLRLPHATVSLTVGRTRFSSHAFQDAVAVQALTWVWQRTRFTGTRFPMRLRAFKAIHDEAALQ